MFLKVMLDSEDWASVNRHWLFPSDMEYLQSIPMTDIKKAGRKAGKMVLKRREIIAVE